MGIAKQHGYEHVINYNKEDFQKTTNKISNVAVDVVFDSVGQTTMAGSFGCLKKHGTLISFGQSSGVYTDLKIGDLQAGSFFLSRPTLFHFTPIPGWLDNATAILFKMIKETSKQHPNDIVSAYKDNVAFVKGQRMNYRFCYSKSLVTDFNFIKNFI